MRQSALLPCLLFALLSAKPVAAVDFEKLVMPGPVVAGHAEVEGECGKCHGSFGSDDENALCLDCHEETQADLDAESGFHGRHPAPAAGRCRACHTEHEGRTADISGLDPESFDHRFTDFALEGAHASTACSACHAPEESRREASSACLDCHREDDSHRGAMGNECGDCHETVSWKAGEFDHGGTDFPLEFAHTKVECALCHPNERYEGTPKACAGCHRLEDSHGGDFGTRCETCHSARAWDESHFSHTRESDFPLEGRHARTACAACHSQPIYEKALESDCYACHRLDDDHRGRNGNQCERCHSAESWKQLGFDHDRDTEFALTGSHREVQCEACHEGSVYEEETPSACNACHADADVHGGQQGSRCQPCHNEKGWSEAVFFDHDLSRFPLLGLHALASCEECHASQRFQDAERECASCHADEFHESRLGETCASCHNPNGWRIWRFDHDARTSFALHGEHEGLDCHSCHRKPARGKSSEIRLSARCYACHARDDHHSGFMGRDCGRCHVESGWDQVEVKP